MCRVVYHYNTSYRYIIYTPYQHILLIYPLSAHVHTHPHNSPLKPPSHTLQHPLSTPPLGGGNEATVGSVGRSIIRSTSLCINLRWSRREAEEVGTFECGENGRVGVTIGLGGRTKTGEGWGEGLGVCLVMCLRVWYAMGGMRMNIILCMMTISSCSSLTHTHTHIHLLIHTYTHTHTHDRVYKQVCAN